MRLKQRIVRSYFHLLDLPTLQGMLFSTSECVKTPVDLVRLWMHEANRVYRDKMVDKNDFENFEKVMREICKKSFEVRFLPMSPLCLQSKCQIINLSMTKFRGIAV